MTNPRASVVFISYCAEDAEWLLPLRTHIAPLERQGIAELWDDTRVRAGDVRDRKIAEIIASARVAIVLVSASYLATDLLERQELRPLLAAAAATGLRVIPIIASACRFEERADVSRFKAVNAPPERPLKAMNPHERDELFLQVSREVELALRDAPQRRGWMEPVYHDAESREHTRRLQDAYVRRDRLRVIRADTSDVDGEIRELRRLLREGGQLRGGDQLGEGRYVLVKEVGRGGFGVVWHARDTALDRVVAIKILHSTSGVAKRERFFRGARAMAKLEHEAIVRVLEPWAKDGDHHYFVMQLIEGNNLRHAVLNKPLRQEEIIPIILRIGEVLDFAHGKGVIHRDIKPENILLDAGASPWLTDFDLVSLPDSSGGTSDTSKLGTFHYAAPELFDRPAHGDARVDVYGLGMTAVFAFLGHAFRLVKDPENTLIERLRCSDDIKRVLRRAISWEVGRRFTSVREFCEALRHAAMGPPPRRDMRRQDLRGRNLRNQDLSSVDLTGAKLFGADLTGASLRNSLLIGADLCHARLEHADLRHADLSSAQLIGAKLRGARLESARLREAKLVGIEIDPGMLDDCDVFGAARSNDEIKPMVGLSSPCTATAFSPDGAYIASGHKDGSVRIWSVATAEARRIISGHKGHKDAVRCVAWSPDGKTLASGSDDATVRFWDVASGEDRRVARGHGAPITSVAWGPDGSMLASGSNDGTVRIWDSPFKNDGLVLEGHDAAVTSVAVSPDGELLASGSEDKTIRLWERSMGTELRVLAGHQAPVRSIAFSPNGTTIASGSDDRTIRLWDAETGVERSALHGHGAGIRSIVFSPDGTTIGSGANDKLVRLWDAETGVERRVFRGHTGPVQSVAHSPDGRTLASGSDDRTLRLWDAESGDEQRVLSGHHGSLFSVAFSPDGEAIATGSNDATVRLWNVMAGTERRILIGHAKQVQSVAYSTDGKMLASGSYDTTIRVWDLAKGTEHRVLHGHGGPILGLSFSDDGKLLASGSYDTTVRLWDLATGEVRSVVEARAPIGSVAFDLNRSMLAIGTMGVTISLQDITTNTVLHGLDVREGPVASLAFSPDGATLASGSRDTIVRLWDVATGVERCALEGHSKAVVSLAFSPDGAALASGSEDKTILLWDAATGALLRFRAEHTAPISSVAFSPDGKMLASSTLDGTVRLWSTATAHCLAVVLPLPKGWVFFTPDGHYRLGGETEGAFWHTMGLCRFEPSEIDELERYLPSPLLIYFGVPLLKQGGSRWPSSL